LACLKFRFLNRLHVWKIARWQFRAAPALHNSLGIQAK